jgi:hypothetical protein
VKGRNLQAPAGKDDLADEFRVGLKPEFGLTERTAIIYATARNQGPGLCQGLKAGAKSFCERALYRVRYTTRRILFQSAGLGTNAGFSVKMRQ